MNPRRSPLCRSPLFILHAPSPALDPLHARQGVLRSQGRVAIIGSVEPCSTSERSAAARGILSRREIPG